MAHGYPLVAMGLVLDGSGFPKRSEVFAGNASEPKTLKTMIQGLQKPHLDNTDDRQKQLFEKNKPTIIMDAGIATEDNINWLKKEHYPNIVVSRKKHREFFDDEAVEVKKDEKTGNASHVTWERKQPSDSPDSYPGVYCLRTSRNDLDESMLWRTYTMLTDLEAVFRSLKSELGLRPVFHKNL